MGWWRRAVLFQLGTDGKSGMALDCPIKSPRARAGEVRGIFFDGDIRADLEVTASWPLVSRRWVSRKFIDGFQKNLARTRLEVPRRNIVIHLQSARQNKNTDLALRAVQCL
jgi:hypothetical protein